MDDKLIVVVHGVDTLKIHPLAQARRCRTDSARNLLEETQEWLRAAIRRGADRKS